MLIEWSYRSPLLMLTNKLILIFEHVVQPLLNMCLWVLVNKATPYHTPLIK